MQPTRLTHIPPAINNKPIVNKQTTRTAMHLSGRERVTLQQPHRPPHEQIRSSSTNVQVEPVPSVRPSVYGPMRACPSRPPSPAGTVGAAVADGGSPPPPTSTAAPDTASTAAASGVGVGTSAIPQVFLRAGEHAAASAASASAKGAVSYDHGGTMVLARV